MCGEYVNLLISLHFFQTKLEEKLFFAKNIFIFAKVNIALTTQFHQQINLKILICKRSSFYFFR